jgi:hypothetical protein
VPSLAQAIPVSTLKGLLISSQNSPYKAKPEELPDGNLWALSLINVYTTSPTYGTVKNVVFLSVQFNPTTYTDTVLQASGAPNT